MSKNIKSERKDSTIAARTGVDSDEQHGAVMPPIYLSTNYTFESLGQPRQYDYSRSGNPTRDLTASAIAGLEGGAGSIMTSSGMSALTLAFYALLAPGDLVLAPHDCYGGTYRLLKAGNDKGHFRMKLVDQTDEKALDAAMAEGPKMVLIETPSNPLLRITDIQVVSEKAHKAGAVSVVDNTFMSPILQKPLKLGADIVVHSTTKYLNGHSDVVGGAAIANTAELHDMLRWWANCLGLTGGAFDSFLTMRGLRTLGVRVKAQQETAQAVIAYLSGHPLVRQIFYPGLPEHRGHDIARNQQEGFGAMFSIELHGDERTIRTCLDHLKLFSLAESLGGVESLVDHPASMTHASMSAEVRRGAGISDTLLRFSIGLEDAEDLIADFETAFAACENKSPAKTGT